MTSNLLADIIGHDWQPVSSAWMEITVDDLLAWLHEHCVWAWGYGGNPLDFWFSLCRPPGDAPQLILDRGHPTLLAALEAAVRYVAETGGS